MKMIHPEIEAVADVVSAETFNQVWAPRGWELLALPETYASEALGKPVKDLEDLKVDELRALVAAKGQEYPAKSILKKDVLESFRESFAEEQAAADALAAGDEPPAAEPEPLIPVPPTPAKPVTGPPAGEAPSGTAKQPDNQDK